MSVCVSVHLSVCLSSLSGDVVTMECVEKLIKKDMLCPISGKQLKDSDIVPLVRVSKWNLLYKISTCIIQVQGVHVHNCIYMYSVHVSTHCTYRYYTVLVCALVCSCTVYGQLPRAMLISGIHFFFFYFSGWPIQWLHVLAVSVCHYYTGCLCIVQHPYSLLLTSAHKWE